MFDPDGPDNLTPEKKLFNIKKKLNSIERKLDEILHTKGESSDTCRIAHLMKAALAEIEKEIDRTV